MIRAQPFLKWAGGKGQLLDQYESVFPAGPVRAYFEPFLGSGAVFFYLRGRGFASEYHLSDSNAELINAFLAVRDRLDELIDRLKGHESAHSREHYYAVRAWDRQPPDDYSDVDRAARLIYLNKTCYNGLWRVNSQG
ncbi:MAG: Dam family site-specific DNA-(adenine-N6)-methyltransferase, partial [Anaerolineae bacterium]|nr:Dam family site-specific DNA-(adenine-N6)-methyltransferase [Anaerolineae bacterium]